MRMSQSVCRHSSEQTTTHFSLKANRIAAQRCLCFSKWFENHRPQRTQIFTVANAPFRSKLESNGLQVCYNRQFSERIFATPAIFKATSKFFSSLGCSDDKNWLDLSSIFLRFVDFAIQFWFHSTRSDARDKFDSGVIFLDQSQSSDTRSNQWDCFILYRS